MRRIFSHKQVPASVDFLYLCNEHDGSNSCASTPSLSAFQYSMGLVRITPWYLKFNESPFGFPPMQLYPQTGWQNRVNYDVFAQAPLERQWSSEELSIAFAIDIMHVRGRERRM